MQVSDLDLLVARVLDLGLKLDDLFGVQVLLLVARVFHLSLPLKKLLCLIALQFSLFLV